MEKEQLLQKIVEGTENVHTTFRWENLYKLSKKELAFIGGMVSKQIVYEKIILDSINNDKGKFVILVDNTIKAMGLEVIQGVV